MHFEGPNIWRQPDTGRQSLRKIAISFTGISSALARGQIDVCPPKLSTESHKYHAPIRYIQFAWPNYVARRNRESRNFLKIAISVFPNFTLYGPLRFVTSFAGTKPRIH